MPPSQEPSLLPAEFMESQLAIIDLLTAMFPSPGEVEIADDSMEHIEKLKDWCDDPSSVPARIPMSIALAVNLPVEDGAKSIQVHVSVPVKCDDPDSTVQPPPLGYVIRQPDWMTKADIAELTTAMPADDALEAFEYIQSETNRFLEKKNDIVQASEEDERKGPGGPIVRVWFYFPSLSTRKKRDDMVNLAPEYSLTGFVLAGKPGVLCLEGISSNIDAYMSFIKTHSWGDIPSHQKKVSERFRQTDGVQRAFSEMEEITDSLGQRSGQRANRGDMQALENWLATKGLQEAFEKVIF